MPELSLNSSKFKGIIKIMPCFTVDKRVFKERHYILPDKKLNKPKDPQICMTLSEEKAFKSIDSLVIDDCSDLGRILVKNSIPGLEKISELAKTSDGKELYFQDQRYKLRNTDAVYNILDFISKNDQSKQKFMEGLASKIIYLARLSEGFAMDS